MENIDWSALGFDYHKTDVNVRYYFTDGKWSDMEVTSDEYIKMHMSASCLHYGIELFEGSRPFAGSMGKSACSVSRTMPAASGLRPNGFASRCRPSKWSSMPASRSFGGMKLIFPPTVQGPRSICVR